MKHGDEPNKTDLGLCQNSHPQQSQALRLFLGFMLWFSFFRLPATLISTSAPQSWEAVLSYGVSHHLQWGTDIIFTYGPLGFLTSDFYWGDHFWIILLWALVFSLFVAAMSLRFLARIAPLAGIVFCGSLLWLTAPHWADLESDPIYLFAITLIGMLGLPSERLGFKSLVALGTALGCVSLIKFTFCLYGLFTLLVVVTAQAKNRSWYASTAFAASSISSCLAAWLLAGQKIGNLTHWFKYSMLVAGDYASAMGIEPTVAEAKFGILIVLCLAGLLTLYLFRSGKASDRFPRFLLVGGGIFLAWKEGFVRADTHVVVFFIYAFLVTALMPALLPAKEKDPPMFRRLALVAVVLVLVPFAHGQEWQYLLAARNEIGRKAKDTATAFLAPLHFKHMLEAELKSRRQASRLPNIAALIGNEPVDVLYYDQDVAILNGFNFHPHPVFQSYSAYTPELQRINSSFFDSLRAPAFVLWRFGTIDGRFPTLDDGKVILRILANYTPVAEESGYVLWRHNAAARQVSFLSAPEKSELTAGKWTPLPAEATWFSLELKETWLGSVKKFLCRGAIPEVAVQLTDGKILSFRVPPGYARAGFIINPLLLSEADLQAGSLPGRRPVGVVAVKVQADRRYFNPSIQFTKQRINSIPALQISGGTGSR